MAISQEDDELAAAEGMAAKLGGDLPFEMGFDLERRVTTAYDRVTAYLIDRDGIVQQIYPMTVRARPSSVILLKDALALAARQRAADAAAAAPSDSTPPDADQDTEG